jgi:hypothetical protein
VVIRVTDNGVPSLGDTKDFWVEVQTRLQELHLEAPTKTNGLFIVRLKGNVGLDYTLQGSSNLVQWHTVMTTNPGISPFLLTDTNPPPTLQYYRVRQP